MKSTKCNDRDAEAKLIPKSDLAERKKWSDCDEL